MGVFRRISGIISANLNDLTEGFEDPERMLRQAVREMEETIAEVTSQTAKAMANENTLERELERNEVQLRQWQDRAKKAVEDNNDDLARKAIARKNEHEKLVAALKSQLDAAGEASGSLRCQLGGMKAKLAEGKRNLATLTARKRAADFRKKMESQAAGAGCSDVDDCAFAKFDRMKAKVEQAEAEAAAMAQLRGMDVGGAVEDIETPQENLDVSAELAELKRQLKK